MKHREVSTILRAEFEVEEAKGFPLLRRIPSSESKRFLRFYRALPVEQRDAFKRTATAVGAAWFGCTATEATIEEYRQWSNLMLQQVSWEDLGVRSLRALRALRASGRTDADFSTMPPEALRWLESMETAKASALRKAAKTVFSSRFGATVEKKAHYCYHGLIHGQPTTLQLDTGSALTQLIYSVNPQRATRDWQRLTYEQVLCVGMGRWDFIEHGAETSAMHTLADVTERVCMLAQRIGVALSR